MATVNELLEYVEQLNAEQKIKDELRRQIALKRIKELRQQYRKQQNGNETVK